ncbi:MAG: FkbM family methyltransferase [Bacteroidia bacterium]|nr:FkbM family methyltransferase [Bacteroidia bacterium]
MKKIYQSLRFWLSARNSIWFIGFYKYLYFPRKGSLSWFLDQYSKDLKGDFTVIQVGANDGINNDPIHKFVRRDKWKGVLLEPQKDIFENSLQKLYRRNSEIVTLNAALGESDGIAHLYKIGFSNSRWATGLASFEKQVLVDAFASGYVKRKADEENISVPPNPEDQIQIEEVPVICPKTLMAKYRIEKIDLLQIDTEGFDYRIIQIFRVSETKPRVIIYENIHLSAPDREACVQHLRENGYRVKVKGANTLAMRNPPEKYWPIFE